MSIRHVRLYRQASSIPRSPASCSVWVMALMPPGMPEEAHCQEDRGINAEIWYILHFSRCILLLGSIRPRFSYVTLHYQIKIPRRFKPSCTIFIQPNFFNPYPLLHIPSPICPNIFSNHFSQTL